MHPEQDAQSIAAAIEADPVVSPLLHALTGDSGFDAAWQSIDVAAFVQHLSGATDHLNQYVSFHQRENRLWSIKIGKGSLPPGVEDGLKQLRHRWLRYCARARDSTLCA